jgi:NTE family protein
MSTANSEVPSQTVAMVLSGGLGLAAYHAGVYQAFARRGLPLHWVAGSSAGAVVAALIAGNRPEDRISRLRAFWNFPPVERADFSPARHLFGWLGAIGTRLTGSAGHFNPRLPSPVSSRFQGFYDLSPMRHRLAHLIDFDRLNGGEPRVCIGTTDVETGDPVIFDSAHVKLEMDHLLASCGFLPEFAPVDVEGRLLGDGGLSLNAPFEPIMQADLHGELLLYVVELYARDGPRPDSLESASERKNDLLFGNQTFMRLQYAMELRKLRRQLTPRVPGSGGEKVILLSYRPGAEEAGPDKSFDLSSMSLALRWKAGLLDFEHAEAMGRDGEIIVVRRPGHNAGHREGASALP